MRMNTDFSNCTKETLQDLINRAKVGEIDLNEYWKVGDERYITISKDEIENLEEDVEVSCSIAYIKEHGVDQQIILFTRVPTYIPIEMRGEVCKLLPKVMKEEFGREPQNETILVPYFVNESKLDETKWTSEKNPQLYGSVNFEDIKWNIGKKRTVPDFLDKFGIV